MVPAAYHGMQIYIPFDENSIFKRTTGSESENYVYQPWQELGSTKSNVSVLTGTIANGGTIPLPAGFSEEQCKFMVSMAEDDPSYASWDINEIGFNKHYYFKCFTVGRVVTAKAYHGANNVMNNDWWFPGRANYLVIGVK